ncbi:hypothetical protein FKP32DRAFT_833740 [Trametes sanguinea]|nr:hypothetical protein FKP32DRAFT_833740 [Trametes sanguinea]
MLGRTYKQRWFAVLLWRSQFQRWGIVWSTVDGVCHPALHCALRLIEPCTASRLSSAETENDQVGTATRFGTLTKLWKLPRIRLLSASPGAVPRWTPALCASCASRTSVSICCSLPLHLPAVSSAGLLLDPEIRLLGVLFFTSCPWTRLRMIIRTLHRQGTLRDEKARSASGDTERHGSLFPPSPSRRWRLNIEGGGAFWGAFSVVARVLCPSLALIMHGQSSPTVNHPGVSFSLQAIGMLWRGCHRGTRARFRTILIRHPVRRSKRSRVRHIEALQAEPRAARGKAQTHA